MSVELQIPSIGESITEVYISEWHVKEGDAVKQDDPVATLETDKATVELPAPVSGIISSIVSKEGDTVPVGAIIGHMEAKEVTQTTSTAPAAKASETKAEATTPANKEQGHVMPAAQRVLAENKMDASQVEATGPGGRVLKEDALRAVSQQSQPKTPSVTAATTNNDNKTRQEDVVPMSPLRRTVARRLVEAQQNAALLTTFNEVDMSAIMKLRKQFQDEFVKEHGVKVGFMSFFVKATIEALKRIPQLNAQVRDNSVVYHNYYDIGIAVGGGKGLVVPILRNAERMSLADIEKTIKDFAVRAKANKIKLEELQGGTFTISNGGVYGSLLSTPIVNPPQSGVLGMHSIQERPIAVNGEVVIRPMMYVAMTYDHRIVDGREAVTFLCHIKHVLENPVRFLLEI